MLVADAGYDGPRLAHVLADLPITVPVRMRTDPVLRRPVRRGLCRRAGRGATATSSLSATRPPGTTRRCHRRHGGARRYPKNVRALEYAPESVVQRYNLPLHATSDAVSTTIFSTTELAAARTFALERARDGGLGPERFSEVELIVDELVTNSLLHAGSPAELSVWRDGEHVICQVADHGRMTDPLAGRHPAPPDQFGGCGLLLVHALADLVRVHTSDDGTTIRAYLHTAATGS